MLVECADLQETQGEYYTADYLKTLFEKIPEICIVEFLREAGLLYLIRMVNYSMELIIWTSSQPVQFWTWNSPPPHWATHLDLLISS